MTRPGDHFTSYELSTPEFQDADGEWYPPTTVTGLVVAVVWPHVVYTPIYDPRHKKQYFVTTVDRVVQGKAELEAELEYFGKQQAAEIAAERAIPQHLVW